MFARAREISKRLLVSEGANGAIFPAILSEKLAVRVKNYARARLFRECSYT